MSFSRIAVLGLGKVGHLAAELLQDGGFAVTGIDTRPSEARVPVIARDLADPDALTQALSGFEAVLSCLPYALNRAVAYEPRLLAGRMRTAIAWTTASSVVAVIEMVRTGALPSRGFLKQEDIPFAPYLATRTGRHFEVTR